MKIRKVSAELLDARPADRPLSHRAMKRRALEAALEGAIRLADAESQAAFRIDLDAGEKPATVRLAFIRVRQRLGATQVNIFKRDDSLYIAKRPQTRGRRPTRV